MKIIEMGTTYKIYGEDLVVLDNLPAQTYLVGFDPMSGFYLEKYHELEINEDKIYGVHNKKVDKVLNRFLDSRKNLGVILSGNKGIGKSLFARLLSQKVIKQGMPVILVDKYTAGIANFLDSIKNEVMVLFDEFDKTFKDTGDFDPQAEMLSLFDGTSSGKKLFVITCNKTRELNEFLINRPGRFHFHLRFDYPSADEVREYLRDKLMDKYHSEINKVVEFSRKVKLNFDCLSAIALELNDGEKFEDAIQDLNIVDIYEDKNTYTVRLYTEEGVIFDANDIKLSLFGDDNNSVYVTDNEGSGIDVNFKGSDAEFNLEKKNFVVRNNKLHIDYDPDYIASGKEEAYKNLHYAYMEIRLDYGESLHYIL